VLDQVMRDLPLDFMLLISSMTAITGGGPGQLEYCASNAYLDAYAQAVRKTSSPPGQSQVSVLDQRSEPGKCWRATWDRMSEPPARKRPDRRCLRSTRAGQARRR